jgi:hypothetical protein
MTGDDYGLRSVFASLRRDKGEVLQDHSWQKGSGVNAS